MIKVILLKDAVASRGIAFAKAVVEQNGFNIELGVGHIKKSKDTVAAAGTVVMELPDTYVERIKVVTESFTPSDSDEVKQMTYLKIA